MKCRCRFDSPDCTAIVGSVLRHAFILRGVGTVFRRQGYEADLKTIAKARPEDCVQALCGGVQATGHKAPQGVSAAKPDRIFRGARTSQALRHRKFCGRMLTSDALYALGGQ